MIQLPRSTGSRIFLPVAATVLTSLLIRQVVAHSAHRSNKNCTNSSSVNKQNSICNANIYYCCYKYRSSIHRLKDGSLYIGSMKDELPHGEGILFYAKNDSDEDTHGQFKHSFEGHFDKGTPICGTCTYKDGTQMEGPIVRGKVHGCGTLRLPDGSVYKGDFQYNTIFGEGEFVHDDGRKVAGHFVDGVLHGAGHIKTANGDSVRGQWREGKPLGNMVVNYADGSLYEGEVIEKGKIYLKHGQGVFQTNYDTQWKGSWKDNLAHGSFTILQRNGTCLKSKFREGMECGNMVYTSIND